MVLLNDDRDQRPKQMAGSACYARVCLVPKKVEDCDKFSNSYELLRFRVEK